MKRTIITIATLVALTLGVHAQNNTTAGIARYVAVEHASGTIKNGLTEMSSPRDTSIEVVFHFLPTKTITLDIDGVSYVLNDWRKARGADNIIFADALTNDGEEVHFTMTFDKQTKVLCGLTLRRDNGIDRIHKITRVKRH